MEDWSEPSQLDFATVTDESSLRLFQEVAATWGTYDALAQLPLALVINMLLSAYCDKVGHKVPYMVGMVGNSVATIYMALLATPQLIDLPMGSVLGFSALMGISGSYGMVNMTYSEYSSLF